MSAPGFSHEWRARSSTPDFFIRHISTKKSYQIRAKAGAVQHDVKLSFLKGTLQAVETIEGSNGTPQYPSNGARFVPNGAVHLELFKTQARGPVLDVFVSIDGSDSYDDYATVVPSNNITGSRKIAKNIVLLPIELIRKNDNSAYDPNTEALGVSNYVTTDGLPQDSQFNDTCDDPENFRLQARVLDPQTNSVQMKLEVIRGGSAVVTHNYTLDKKDGDFVRGRFLRLVSDSSDDAASGAGTNSDPNNQTILAKLGDKIKVSYDIAPGSKVEQEIQIGRPSSENNNDTTPWKHDIRKLKLRLAVFKDANGNPCATDMQINQDIEDANERLAQAGIVIERSNGNTADQLARPAALADGYSDSPGFVTLGTPDENAVAPLKDNDANTIDVFYVHLLVTGSGRGTAYGVARNQSNDPKYNNMIIIGAGSAGGGDPMNLAHEIMHILLNSPHRNDPNTALFKGGTTLNKNVDFDPAPPKQTSLSGSSVADSTHRTT